MCHKDIHSSPELHNPTHQHWNKILRSPLFCYNFIQIRILSMETYITVLYRKTRIMLMYNINGCLSYILNVIIHHVYIGYPPSRPVDDSTLHEHFSRPQFSDNLGIYFINESLIRKTEIPITPWQRSNSYRVTCNQGGNSHIFLGRCRAHLNIE